MISSLLRKLYEEPRLPCPGVFFFVVLCVVLNVAEILYVMRLLFSF